jgi:hypothetical protein
MKGWKNFLPNLSAVTNNHAHEESGSVTSLGQMPRLSETLVKESTALVLPAA